MYEEAELNAKHIAALARLTLDQGTTVEQVRARA
jgi:hypothetical protein